MGYRVKDIYSRNIWANSHVPAVYKMNDHNRKFSREAHSRAAPVKTPRWSRMGGSKYFGCSGIEDLVSAESCAESRHSAPQMRGKIWSWEAVASTAIDQFHRGGRSVGALWHDVWWLSMIFTDRWSTSGDGVEALVTYPGRIPRHRANN